MVQHCFCIKPSLQRTLCMSRCLRRLSADPAASDAAMTLSKGCSAPVRMSCKATCREVCIQEGTATSTKVQSHLLIGSTQESSRLPACLRRTAQDNDDEVRLGVRILRAKLSFTSVCLQESSSVVQQCLEPGLSALPHEAARIAPPPDRRACVAVINHSLTCQARVEEM